MPQRGAVCFQSVCRCGLAFWFVVGLTGRQHGIIGSLQPNVYALLSVDFRKINIQSKLRQFSVCQAEQGSKRSAEAHPFDPSQPGRTELCTTG